MKLFDSLINQIKSGFVKNIFIIFSGNTIAQIVPFLIYPLLSRLYTPEQFGTLALYLGITSVLSILATGRYEFAILLPKTNNQALHLMKFSNFLSLFIILLILPFLFFNDFIAALLNDPQLAPWLWFLPFSIVFAGLTQPFKIYASRISFFKAISVFYISLSLINSGLRLLLGYLDYNEGLLASTIFSQVIAAGLFFMLLRKQINYRLTSWNFETSRKEARSYTNFPKYNLPHALLNTLSSSLPYFVFASYFSTEITGYYSFAFMLVFKPINLLGNAISNVLAPRVVSLKNEGKHVFFKIKQLAAIMGIGSIILFIPISIFSVEIFDIVFGKDWQEAGKMLQLLTPWFFVLFFTAPFSFIPNIYGQQKKALYIDIVYFVIRVLALAIGIYFEDAYLAIGLFSISGLLVISYSFIWFLRIVKSEERT